MEFARQLKHTFLFSVTCSSTVIVINLSASDQILLGNSPALEVVKPWLYPRPLRSQHQHKTTELQSDFRFGWDGNWNFLSRHYTIYVDGLKTSSAQGERFSRAQELPEWHHVFISFQPPLQRPLHIQTALAAIALHSAGQNGGCLLIVYSVALYPWFPCSVKLPKTWLHHLPQSLAFVLFCYYCVMSFLAEVACVSFPAFAHKEWPVAKRKDLGSWRDITTFTVSTGEQGIRK